MSPEMIDLARRVVACKGWRWMPGMADTDGCRFVSFDKGATWVWVGPGGVSHAHGTRLPDLTDPATLGCVLALVREAWGDLTAHYDGYGVWVRLPLERDGEGHVAESATEAEALVAALEAA